MLQWTKTRLIQVEVALTVDNALKELHTYKPVTSEDNPLTIFYDSENAAHVQAIKYLISLDEHQILNLGSKYGSTFVSVSLKFPSLSLPENIDSIAVISRINYGYEEAFSRVMAIEQILKVIPASPWAARLARYLPTWIMDPIYRRLWKKWETTPQPEEPIHVPDERFFL